MPYFWQLKVKSFHVSGVQMYKIQDIRSIDLIVYYIKKYSIS